MDSVDKITRTEVDRPKSASIPKKFCKSLKRIHECVDQAHRDEEGDRKDNNFVLGFHENGSRFSGFVERKGPMITSKCCARMIRGGTSPPTTLSLQVSLCLSVQ
jgi:hypothetical protein